MTAPVRHREKRSDEAIQAKTAKAGPPRGLPRNGTLKARLGDVAIFALTAIFAAAVSWLAYWTAFGMIFAPNIHPDYWPREAMNAIQAAAAVTGIAAALLLFRMISARNRR